MKRYLVFAWVEYEPTGGWGDYHSSYASLEEAEKCHVYGTDITQIVDTETMNVVKEINWPLIHYSPVKK